MVTMADFETLNLTITADTAKASSGLDSLTKSLSTFQTMLNSIDGTSAFNSMNNLTSGIQALVSGLSGLGNSMAMLQGVTDVMRTTATAVSTIAAATQGLDGGNLSSLAAGISDLSTSLSEASNVIGFARFDSAATNLEAFTSAINVLQGALATFSSSVDTSSMNALASLTQGIAQMGSSMGSINADAFSALAAGINHVATATASIDDATIDRVVRLADALTQLSTAAAGAEGLGSLQMPNLGGGGSNASSAMQNVQTFLEGFASNYASGMKKVGSLLGGAVRTGGKAASAALQGVGNAAKFMYDKFSLSTLMGNNLLSSLMRMAKMRILRSIIRGIANAFKEGMQNIAHYSAAANATLSQFSTGASYVKNSLAASLYPAIASMVGIFNALISVVVRAMNVINMLFSILGGKTTYTRATKQTKDFASATGGAAGAASALKQELMGFDEINALSPSGGGGGGGGGGFADYGGMFEEAPIEEWVQNMMNSGDFSELGRRIAAKINESLGRIKWTDIKAGAKKLANSIATAINGFIAEINPSVIGATIAGIINTATTFVDHFWSTTNWAEMGAKVKQALLNALSKIDVTSLGRSITGKLRGMVDFINGWLNSGGKSVLGTVGTKVGETVNAALESLDAGELASALVGVLQGAANGAVNLINTINWDNLMSQVNKFLADAIENAPWTQIREALTTLLKKAIKFFTLPSTQSNIQNLTTKVTTFVVNAINSIEWDQVGIALAGIANAIAKGLKNALAGSEGETAKATMLDGVKAFFETIDFEAIIDIASIALNSGVGKALTLWAVGSALLKMIPTATGLKIGAAITFAIPGIFDIAASIGELTTGSSSGGGDSLSKIGALVGKALFGAAGAAIGYTFLGPVGGALGFSVGVKLATALSVAHVAESDTIIDSAVTKQLLEIAEIASSSATPIQIMAGALKELTGINITPEQFAALTGLDLSNPTLTTEECADAIQLLYSKISEAQNNGDIDGFLKSLGLAGTTASDTSNTITDAADTISDAGTTISSTASDIESSTSGIQESIDSVTDATSSLTSATSEMPDTIIIDGSTLGDVESTATKAATAVAGLSSMLTMLQKAFNKFDGSFDSLADSASDANDDVSTLKDTINKIPSSKTISIYTKNITNVQRGIKNVKDALSGLKSVTITISVKAGLTSGARSFLKELKAEVGNGDKTKIDTLLKLSQYARGGFPSSGDIFMANENGRQELVGRIGNQPAVANQDQIGDAIFKYMDQYNQGNGYDTDALASAIVRGIKAAGLGATYLDGKQLANSINKETQRIGKPAIQF